MKKLFLIAFVVGGLTFVSVQRSDAQVFIPENQGFGSAPGVSYGYPHFEYAYNTRGGYYYRQPYYRYNQGPSYFPRGNRVYYRHHRQDEIVVGKPE